MLERAERRSTVNRSDSCRLLGTRVDALTIDQLHARIDESVRNQERRIFGSHNLHSLSLQRTDAKLQAFYERADYVRIDGMAIILLGRLLGLPLRREHRVTYVDWLPLFMAEAQRAGWRVFYLGSKPGVAASAAGVLRGRFPDLQIETADGFFDARADSPANRAVIDAINGFGTNVLMVGMGMPRQQHWVLDNYQKLTVNVISTSGAALDYVAGEIPTPPRWAGRIGLEWFFRLAAEPRRLSRRYLLEPWYLLLPVLQELIQRRARRRPHQD
jgi:N-acetylglucosaminyldiphosphoundecaprenol N-acetyl-beta-D-mannosaminyltransferase